MNEIHPSWGPRPDGSFCTEGETFVVRGPTLTETELLDRARGAFDRWAALSLASRNRKAATLKSFLSWAYDEKLTEKNLAERIACPKVPKRVPHFLSVDEILAVLQSFEGDESPNARATEILILLLYGGGLRVSEACQLRWKDLDASGRLLRVKGKGSKERLVPLPQRSALILQKWRRSQESGDYVFGQKPLSSRVAYEWVRRRGAIAGLIHRLHPHALRHSYATHLLGGGANLRTLQELLGHESLRATERYTHLGVDQLARTLERTHPLGEKALSKRRA